MKRLLFLLLIPTIMVFESLAAGPSAGKIIDRFKKASGGKAAMRVKSTRMTGTVSTNGATGRFSLHTSAPNNFRVDIDVAGSSVSECYNGKSAWRLDSRGLRTLLGDDAKRLRLESLLSNSRLHDLGRNKIVPQLAGTSTIDGRDANAVEFTKDGVRIKIYFDASNNLPIKRERETADGVEEVFYADYKAIDGVMEPFSLKIRKGDTEQLVTIEKVEHNRSVDITAFRYPQVEGSRPLPELEPLLKALAENQDKIDELRERYTCRLVQIERKHDGDGRVKETETRTYEVTPVGDEFVERLMSINGKDLSAAEREKEDKRVQKEVEEIVKRQEKKEQKEERARAKGEKEKDSDDIEIKDFLRISEITSIRREMFRGHEVIAFDFEPRKGFKPKNRGEDIVNKLAGTIWVDEAAQQVARLEARFTASYKIAGGMLASIGPSTAFAFDQEKIGDEVWLPSSMEANLSARVLLLAKFNRSIERRYSDYKKYQIDSKYDLTKPKDNPKQ